jgi:hypothetical protein
LYKSAVSSLKVPLNIRGVYKGNTYIEREKRSRKTSKLKDKWYT